MKPLREEWRTVVGFEDSYEVSNWGRVRSVDREILKANEVIQKWKGRLLRIQQNTNGYRAVTLYKDTVGFRSLISHLVAFAFIGPRPPKMDVAHLDGKLAHNWVGNLEYKTKKANNAQKKQHGTYVCGERAYQAKLKNKDIPAIVSRLRQNESPSRICLDYGVSPNAIRLIKAGKNWRQMMLDMSLEKV